MRSGLGSPSVCVGGGLSAYACYPPPLSLRERGTQSFSMDAVSIEVLAPPLSSLPRGEGYWVFANPFRPVRLSAGGWRSYEVSLSFVQKNSVRLYDQVGRLLPCSCSTQGGLYRVCGVPCADLLRAGRTISGLSCSVSKEQDVQV